VTVPELLAELARLGVTVELAGDGRLSVRAPAGRLSAELRGRMAEHKADIVEWLTRTRAQDETGLPAVEPDVANRDQPFPLSDLQMSFLVGMSEGMQYSVTPHFYCEFDVPALDPVRFEAAVNHALLRQRDNLVVVTDDLRLRRIDDYVPLAVIVHDLRELPGEEAERALLVLRDTMSDRPLPVDRWPWQDWQISLLAGGRARVHANLSNFFGDGYGTIRLLASIQHYYATPDRPLPDLTLTYRDAVLALAELEKSPLGQRSKSYWEQRLDTLPDAPALPLRPGLDATAPACLSRREIVIPPATWSALRRNAGTFGLTPSTALYAIYAELIAVWGGSRHFLLNNMMTHRLPIHPELAEILGNFASLYPLEVDWRGCRPFHERAGGLQDQVMADLQHSYWSGVKVLEALNRSRGTPGQAACPFVMASGLFMGPQQRLAFARLETPQVLIDHQFFQLADGSVLVVFDVMESAFPDGLVDAICSAHRLLSARLAEDVDAWSAPSFDLLPAEERDRRAELNRATAPATTGRLHGGLAAAAAATPDRAALVTASGTLSYRQLHSASTRLAGRLAAFGAAGGEPIAVVLPKGADQVVAVHAILAAGAAYVPVDPNWPAERIHYVVTHTTARLVVTDARHAERLDVSDARVVLVDGDDATGGAAAGAELVAPVAGHDPLAYVIYTSGSTGLPKGVAVGHHGPLNTILDVNRRFGIDADDVIFGISSLSFDLSVYDLFGSAAAGATLLLPDPEQWTPQAWLESMVRHRATVWNSAPALMQLLVHAAELSGVRLPALRTVLLSGDWIPLELPDQIRRMAPNAKVISLGGATEASIWSIYFPVEQVERSWASIPYGRPLANQSWHVLDTNGRDAPAWVTGELHIGGAGLAKGYWRDEGKTAAAFVRHPVTSQPLYRTGDLGRYWPDGTIEFLGRADHQVKIQGYRVELGEVEHALSVHEGVRGAAVIAVQTETGRQLAAFVVAADPERPVDGDALREHVAGKLPAYMVPSQVLVLDRLPVTTNGKLDRTALAGLWRNGASRVGASPAGQPHVAPRTPTEAALAGIWREVLAVERVGVHDDFFAIGGHSFAALLVSTTIADELGRRVGLGVILQERTVARLAALLDGAAGRSGHWSPLVELCAAGAGTPLALVHPAGGNVLCYRAFAERLGRPCYGLQAPGLSGEQAPAADVRELAARYVHALRAARPHGPYLLAGWSSGAVLAFEVAAQLQAVGEPVERLIVLDAPAPLDHRPVDEVSMVLWFLEDLAVGFDPGAVDAGTLRRLRAAPSARDRLTLGLSLLPARGSPAAPDAGHLGPVFDVFRATVAACRAYRPEPITADLCVIRAADGAVSEFADHPAAASPDWGWAGLTTGRVHCVTAPGRHHTILTDHVGAVVDELRRQLG
jgi:amino acid adenylation domain-containing protein